MANPSGTEQGAGVGAEAGEKLRQSFKAGADTMRAGADAARTGAAEASDFMREASAFWQRAAQNAAGGANGEVIERMRQISRETAAFVEDRMQKDLAIAERLASAKSPVDLMQIQMDFFQVLVSDYNRQAAKVAEEAGKTMQTVLGAWQNAEPRRGPGAPH